MKSKTRIKNQASKKTNPIVLETIKEANKHKDWNEVAGLLSAGARSYISKNLYEIDKETMEGDTVVIVGKVLSKGDLSKKIRICALNVSEKAKEKAGKSEIVSILEEIKKNARGAGLKILK
jgi:large subunit ribosomal protein L18e